MPSSILFALQKQKTAKGPVKAAGVADAQAASSDDGGGLERRAKKKKVRTGDEMGGGRSLRDQGGGRDVGGWCEG